MFYHIKFYWNSSSGAKLKELSVYLKRDMNKDFLGNVF